MVYNVDSTFGCKREREGRLLRARAPLDQRSVRREGPSGCVPRSHSTNLNARGIKQLGTGPQGRTRGAGPRAAARWGGGARTYKAPSHDEGLLIKGHAAPRTGRRAHWVFFPVGPLQHEQPQVQDSQQAQVPQEAPQQPQQQPSAGGAPAPCHCASSAASISSGPISSTLLFCLGPPWRETSVSTSGQAPRRGGKPGGGRRARRLRGPGPRRAAGRRGNA